MILKDWLVLLTVVAALVGLSWLMAGPTFDFNPAPRIYTEKIGDQP